MTELYWITRCDSITTTLIVFTLIGIIVSIISFIYSAEFNKSYKIPKISASLCIFFILINTFIPSTKDALMIYGIGGTIDYVKSDSTARQLPHKVIMALDKYLEKLNNETNKEE